MSRLTTTRKVIESWLKVNGYVNGAKVRVMAMTNDNNVLQMVVTIYKVPQMTLDQIKRDLPSLADAHFRRGRS